jgi:diguanylate cyclase (GGDEF)-like protein
VARLGGEEFLVICRHSGREAGMASACKLRTAIEQHGFSGVGRVTASFGVAVYREGDTVTTLLGRADAALYCAKDNGRNRVEIEND